jgi:hypothetical protein
MEPKNILWQISPWKFRTKSSFSNLDALAGIPAVSNSLCCPQKMRSILKEEYLPGFKFKYKIV